MKLESSKIREIDPTKNIEHLVSTISSMHCIAAEKYLPEGELRDQIIKFYSDLNRLSKELTHVFQNMSTEEKESWMKEQKEIATTEDLFIEFANTKNFATNLQEKELFESTN